MPQQTDERLRPSASARFRFLPRQLAADLGLLPAPDQAGPGPRVLRAAASLLYLVRTTQQQVGTCESCSLNRAPQSIPVTMQLGGKEVPWFLHYQHGCYICVPMPVPSHRSCNLQKKHLMWSNKAQGSWSEAEAPSHPHCDACKQCCIPHSLALVHLTKSRASVPAQWGTCGALRTAVLAPFNVSGAILSDRGPLLIPFIARSCHGSHRCLHRQ
jgi:hypothetical protein